MEASEKLNLVKIINNNWALDTDSQKGYSVKIDQNDNIISYKEAFSYTVDGDNVRFTKGIKVPLRVIKESKQYILSNIK